MEKDNRSRCHEYEQWLAQVLLRESGFIWDSMDPQPNSPLGYFRLFMNEEILKLILDQTTLYLNQFLDKYQDEEEKILNIYANLSISYDDIWLFLGSIIYMGIIKLPSYRHHWKTALFRSSILPTIISRNRFDLIKIFFHLNDNNLANPKDKLYKVRTYLSRSIYLWKKYFSPIKLYVLMKK